MQLYLCREPIHKYNNYSKLPNGNDTSSKIQLLSHSNLYMMFSWCIYMPDTPPAGVQRFMWIYPLFLQASSYIHTNLKLLRSRWYILHIHLLTMVYILHIAIC